jgi:hypothetical protein
VCGPDQCEYDSLCVAEGADFSEDNCVFWSMVKTLGAPCQIRHFLVVFVTPFVCHSPLYVGVIAGNPPGPRL